MNKKLVSILISLTLAINVIPSVITFGEEANVNESTKITKTVEEKNNEDSTNKEKTENKDENKESQDFSKFDLDTNAEAALAIDYDTGEVILSKNADKKMYPASITKLMTALILAESSPRDKEFKFSKKALDVEPFSINSNMFILPEGDTILAEDLMKAILMISANDGAMVAAEGIGGSEEKFVTLMNNKAQELGMKNTHFKNPIGLHDDDHYTTAKDISILLKASFNNPWMREVMGIQKDKISTEAQNLGEITNSNINLGKNGNVAGKTGFTDEAGKCLATVFQRDGRTIMLILLNDGATFQDQRVHKDTLKVADEAFNAKKEVVVKADEPLTPQEVTFKLFKYFGPEKKVLIKMSPTSNLEIYKNSYNEKNKKLLVSPIPSLNVFNLRKGDKVADVSLNVDGVESKVIAVSNSSTFDSIFRPNIVDYLIWIVSGLLILLVLFTIGIKLINSKKSVQQRNRKRRQAKRRKVTRFKKDNDL